MSENQEKALVLLSGGLDSTTVLAWAIDRWGKENVFALSISYGQKHVKELLSVNAAVEHYGVECFQLCLPTEIWEGSDCTLLQGQGEIEESTYGTQINLAQQEGKAAIDTSVPFRNGVFLSIATAQAISRGCTHVVIATHMDDSGAAYPDCGLNFLTSMHAAMSYGTNHSVSLASPFDKWTKDEIVEWGLAHDVPYELTWSCYKGGERACGKCATCLDRLRAFQMNKAVDPIEYEEGIEK